ncbi:MAG: response regulator transcription factor [Pseudomonadota bacterium]
MSKLIIADDHPLFRSALIGAISGAFPMRQTVETDSFDSTCAALDQHPDADLLLLDLHMPGSYGFFGLIQLRKNWPTLPIVVISASDDVDVIRRCMAFGASGFVPKSARPDDICTALNTVLQGDIWVPARVRQEVLQKADDPADLDLAARVAQLTPQQYKVLYYLTEGWLNKQIAYDLAISEATVKAHMTAIFRKLGVHNRTQVVIATQRLTLEPPGERALHRHGSDGPESAE